jgi:hypothetical protein
MYQKSVFFLKKQGKSSKMGTGDWGWIRLVSACGTTLLAIYHAKAQRRQGAKGRRGLGTGERRKI